jgi:hypothetical protein
MTNANIKIAQSSATLKTAGTLAGLWCLCVFCCFSSSAASIASVIRGLQSVPGKVVEVGEALKSDQVAYMKLYKECEDTDHVNGFEIKLSEVSEGDSGTFKTEDGVTIKKIICKNLSFDMTYTAVHVDNFEAEVTMTFGQMYQEAEFLFGDCGDAGSELAAERLEEHGKVMFIKDINIKWKPALKNYQKSQRDAEEIGGEIEGYSIKK